MSRVLYPYKLIIYVFLFGAFIIGPSHVGFIARYIVKGEIDGPEELLNIEGTKYTNTMSYMDGTVKSTLVVTADNEDSTVSKYFCKISDLEYAEGHSVVETLSKLSNFLYVWPSCFKSNGQVSLNL